MHISIRLVQFQHHDVRDLEKIPVPHVKLNVYDLSQLQHPKYVGSHINPPSYTICVLDTLIAITESWHREASSHRVARIVPCARPLPRPLVHRLQLSEPRPRQPCLLYRPPLETSDSFTQSRAEERTNNRQRNLHQPTLATLTCLETPQRPRPRSTCACTMGLD